jgi:hypothetical protein
MGCPRAGFSIRQNSLIPAKRRSLWAGPVSPGPG